MPVDEDINEFPLTTNEDAEWLLGNSQNLITDRIENSESDSDTESAEDYSSTETEDQPSSDAINNETTEIPITEDKAISETTVESNVEGEVIVSTAITEKEIGSNKPAEDSTEAIVTNDESTTQSVPALIDENLNVAEDQLSTTAASENVKEEPLVTDSIQSETNIPIINEDIVQLTTPASDVVLTTEANENAVKTDAPLINTEAVIATTASNTDNQETSDATNPTQLIDDSTILTTIQTATDKVTIDMSDDGSGDITEATAICNLGEILCDGKCVTKCNGVSECSDESDEKECPGR